MEGWGERGMLTHGLQEKFEDTKGITRSRANLVIIETVAVSYK